MLQLARAIVGVASEVLRLVVSLLRSPERSAQPSPSSYPTKTIKLVVPFTAGSATDILARIVGDRLAARWSQAVVVENKPGAGGTIGAAVVAKAEPDGYTLAVVSVGHVVNPHIYRDLPYDTISLFGFLNRWNDTLATPLEEEAIEVGERLLAGGAGALESTKFSKRSDA